MNDSVFLSHRLYPVVKPMLFAKVPVPNELLDLVLCANHSIFLGLWDLGLISSRLGKQGGSMLAVRLTKLIISTVRAEITQ